MAKGEVINTFADASGVWYADVEASEGNGEREIFGCTLQTVCNRAAKAIHAEIVERQAQAPSPVKVDYVGMLRRDSDGAFFARFRER